ncbi:MAG: methionine--tRNA ligase [Candidatus Moraniibacteriota bacterium]
MPTKKHNKPPIFIGVAWPYANGSLHLGHAAGLIGADYLARYYRLKGQPVLMVSGSDCHGTPIEVKAEQEKTTPKKIAEKYDKEFHATLIKGLGFSYDLFTKTANPFHHKLVQKYFLDLLDKGFIYEKTQNLPYCKKDKRFLPDRYIEGECPVCHFPSARGDQCDNCGSILDAKDLINPCCKICGEKPVWKDSKHFFLKLTAFQKELLSWVKKSKGWRPNARNFTIKFLEKGLLDRAITRDSEWGIPVPVRDFEGKTIYVWFEAVSGYLTASLEYSKKIGKPDYWKTFWQNKNCIHYYIHGKDNIPFHSIIWPSILLGLGKLNLPDRIVSSEYLTFSGKQFSKSRKWGIWLPEFLEKYDPDTLRYYLGVNGPENADTDFSWKEYQTKINTELIGKFGNFINRVLSFTENNFQSIIPKLNKPDKSDKIILESCDKLFGEVGKYISATKFQAALKKIIKFSEDCNRYIDQKEPWKTVKTDKQTTANTLYVCLQAISALQLLSSPFLPHTSEKILQQLKIPARKNWKFSEIPAGHKIGKSTPLFERVEISK